MGRKDKETYSTNSGSSNPLRKKEGKRKDIFSGEGRIKGKLRGRRWYRDPGKKNNSLQRHNFIFLYKHMHGVLSTILIVPIKCFVSGKVKKLTISDFLIKVI